MTISGRVSVAERWVFPCQGSLALGGDAPPVRSFAVLFDPAGIPQARERVFPQLFTAVGALEVEYLDGAWHTRYPPASHKAPQNGALGLGGRFAAAGMSQDCPDAIPRALRLPPKERRCPGPACSTPTVE